MPTKDELLELVDDLKHERDIRDEKIGALTLERDQLEADCRAASLRNQELTLQLEDTNEAFEASQRIIKRQGDHIKTLSYCVGANANTAKLHRMERDNARAWARYLLQEWQSEHILLPGETMAHALRRLAKGTGIEELLRK